jgi:prefoldin subunit 5
MEGIIFKDIFIDNEAKFIEAFIEHLKANKTKIEKAIKDLSNFLKNVSVKTLNAVNSEVFLSIWD